MTNLDIIDIALTDLDLEVAAGGLSTSTCTTTLSRVETPKGFLDVGTTSCDGGFPIPFAVWTPSK